MEIERVENGFIVVADDQKRVFQTLDEVFEHMLEFFEQRHPWRGKKVGRVTIVREES